MFLVLFFQSDGLISVEEPIYDNTFFELRYSWLSAPLSNSKPENIVKIHLTEEYRMRINLNERGTSGDFCPRRVPFKARDKCPEGGTSFLRNKIRKVPSIQTIA